jgi:hypothetical protein
MLLIGLVPSLVVSLVAFVAISRELTNKTVGQLESLAIKQEQRIQGLLQKKKEEIIKLANSYDLQSELSTYLSGDKKAHEGLNAILYNKKIGNSDIQAAYLTDLKNNVIAVVKGKRLTLKVILRQTSKVETGWRL